MLSIIKARLPWWSEIIRQVNSFPMPKAYRFWQGMGLFRHGYMDAAGYALGVFDAHMACVGLDGMSLEGKPSWKSARAIVLQPQSLPMPMVPERFWWIPALKPKTHPSRIALCATCSQV